MLRSIRAAGCSAVSDGVPSRTASVLPNAKEATASLHLHRLTKAQGLSLLASAVENLNAGCVCQFSGIADGDAPHAQKGCRAQAWTISELLRVWLAL